LKLGAAIGNAVTFTGGDGTDAVLVGATTKAITMGAGDDKVTISADVGTGGSIDGGTGTDTLVINAATGTFNNPAGQPRITGFETLGLGASATGSYSAAGFTAMTHGAVTGAVTYTNVANNTELTITASPTQAATVTLADATGSADAITVTLSSDGDLTGNTVNLNGIETVTLNNVDTKTSTLNDNTVTLVSDKATTLNVTGNVDVNITSSSAAKITTFNASSMEITKVTANGVEYTSANVVAGENVTITGSNGVDILAGQSVTHDTINGGDGADTIKYDGGKDVLTGGAGKDTFDINADGTATVYATIADLATGDKIDLAGVADGTNAIADGKIGAATTYGAGATFAQALNAAAAGTGGATTSTADWFQYDGNTYLVVDNSNNATWTAGTDSVIAITGLVDLKDATFATEVLTIA